MKTFLLILFLLPILIFGQSDAKPGLYEVVYLKINKGQEKAFEAAVKKHNLEFHKEGSLYHAGANYIINGPYGGQYSWNMGPTNFTALDTRPAKGAHDDDWKNVLKYVESSSSPTYWNEDRKLSARGTSVSGGKSMVWIFDLKSGKTERWSELVAKINEVYVAKRPNESMFVYWNEFSDTKAGRDVAVLFPFEKWAWLDREATFHKDYESVHGPGTWSFFLSEFSDCIDGRVDFLRERVK